MKIIYTTPEKIENSEIIKSILDELYRNDKLDRFVIDEAHCVSGWGNDFRPDYLKLCFLKKSYPIVPMIALTATATEKVKEEIIERLGMNGALYFQSSFNRKNLVYEIRKKDKNVLDEIVKFI